jgi:TatD DNase family protein
VTDSHAHLDACEESPALLVERAAAAGVTRIVTIGTGIESCRTALATAEESAGVYAVLGVDPHRAATPDADRLKELRELLSHPRAVAVGETGLDYYYDHSPRDAQRDAFARHIELAGVVGKPLVCHVRDAHDDALRMLDQAGIGRAGAPGGVIHCFTGNAADARGYLALGLHLSFSGILTFKKADDIREAAALAPLDRVLIETDAPYLAPIPNRGRRNEPAFVVETLKQLAITKALTIAETAAATTANARALFRI